MVLSTLYLILILTSALVISGLLVFLWLSRNTVSKNDHNKIQKDLYDVSNSFNIEKEKSDKLDLLNREYLVKYENLSRLKNDLDLQINSHVNKLEFISESLENEQKISFSQKREIAENTQLISELSNALSVQKSNYQHLQEKIENQKKDFQELKEKSLLEFKQAANILLEEKSERFAKMNQQNIEQILKPLGENIRNFKKQVEETYDKESKQRFSLEDKIKDLVKLNNQISQEAQNLTNALKGQAKTQGDWGEMILENILEHSGLNKNREYFVQDSFRDESGAIKRPDIIIKYPDDRAIIIDSKVSLVSYERLTNTEDAAQMEIHLAAHIKSLRKHIDDLSAKEYDKFEKTLDFVMLFVPIEPAYMVAMQQDPELWNYAYTKRILLISPTNLIAALKMVADIWKRDDQNKNAREIAKRGEALYDKFVGFVNDLESIEKHLSKADDSWKEAMQKLKSGRGNLIGQAEKLRKLGLKPKKTLPEPMLLDQEEE